MREMMIERLQGEPPKLWKETQKMELGRGFECNMRTLWCFLLIVALTFTFSSRKRGRLRVK